MIYIVGYPQKESLSTLLNHIQLHTDQAVDVSSNN